MYPYILNCTLTLLETVNITSFNQNTIKHIDVLQVLDLVQRSLFSKNERLYTEWFYESVYGPISISFIQALMLGSKRRTQSTGLSRSLLS